MSRRGNWIKEEIKDFIWHSLWVSFWAGIAFFAGWNAKVEDMLPLAREANSGNLTPVVAAFLSFWLIIMLCRGMGFICALAFEGITKIASNLFGNGEKQKRESLEPYPFDDDEIEYNITEENSPQTIAWLREEGLVETTYTDYLEFLNYVRRNRDG